MMEVKRGSSPARIDESEEEGDYCLVPCLYATCLVSEDEIGPIWGVGDASRKRALATLTEECSCGARFHHEAEG